MRSFCATPNPSPPTQAIRCRSRPSRSLLSIARSVVGPSRVRRRRCRSPSELVAGSMPCRFHFLGNRQHVGRRDHDDHRRLEVLDQLHLFFRLPAGHRYHGTAELLRAVMRAETAGEEWDRHRRRAGCRPRVHPRRGSSAPSRSTRWWMSRTRVSDDRGLARRTGRCRLDTQHLLARNREHAERNVLAQVRLDREREMCRRSWSAFRSPGFTPLASNALR